MGVAFRDDELVRMIRVGTDVTLGSLPVALDLHEGDLVRLHALASVGFNGLNGVLGCFDAPSGRWVVHIGGRSNASDSKRFLPRNVTLVGRAGSCGTVV